MTSLSSVTSGAVSAASNGAPVVGFLAGWALEFRKDDGHGLPDPDADPVLVSHADCDAEIKVDADDQLRAATFDITLDGLLDKVYAAIAAESHVHVVVRLGWQDLGKGFGAALAGAVAPFGIGGRDDDGLHEVLAGRLLSVERSHGEFRYRTRLQGIDAAFFRMQRQAPRDAAVPAGSTAFDYARQLCQDTAVAVTVVQEGTATAIDGKLDTSADRSVVTALQKVAQLAHGDDRRFVVPMFLRAGVLHVGRWKAPVLKGGSWELSPATGLVDGRPVAETGPGAALPEAPFAAPKVRRFDLTLLGRPDIAVGDKVSAALPDPASAGAAGTVSGSAIGPAGDLAAGVAAVFRAGMDTALTDYGVVGVRHQLGPAEGFVTRLTVALPAEDDRTTAAPESGSTDEATRLAAALAEQHRRTALERRTHEVGLVRRQDVTPASADGHGTAAQTLCVDEGLADAPSPNVPTTAGAAADPTRLIGKPYLTPFAFGGTGLVVPHYPGMRVVSLHYREEQQNAVVAGCLWEDGQAPESHVGDWWLCLPANLAGAGAGAGAAGPPSGPASHDLISGDGGRVIEVRGLRISVGADLMTPVGTRPQDAADDRVVIEHAKAGARIGIDASGTIEIASGSDATAARITIGSGGDIEISTPGNLLLKGDKITLQSNTTVEVP
ncbi:hypothetical protein [Streptomyces sp. RKAG293]|uniref:hypothetical protein n=1 Tax=Streptomyces sp. RKAG293 TaxID=2893403 RepID=UPI0020332417|nr:hypothetical protein [Streptomyces sp. RKAG293]MCM2422897.1 hypothetical protein [Streptomyces sp. RKAG293]